MSSHSNEGSADGSSNRLTSRSRGEFYTGIYGPPQFTEADVLACMSEVEKEEEGKRDIFKPLIFANLKNVKTLRLQ